MQWLNELTSFIVNFRQVLREEVERLVKRPFPKAEAWIYSPHNRPFEPDCSSTVEDLLKMSYSDFANLVMDGAAIGEHPTPTPPPPYPDSIMRGGEVTIEVGLEGENENIVRDKSAKTVNVNFAERGSDDEEQEENEDNVEWHKMKLFSYLPVGKQ